jgi:hypothetical protein
MSRASPTAFVRVLAVAIAVAGAVGGGACGGAATPRGRVATLRLACADGERWNGAGCQPRGGRAEVEAAATAVGQMELDAAMSALDRAAAAPLDHDTYLRLWEERGIAWASAEDAGNARTAFARLLEADPGHAIDCERGGKIYRPFQDARAEAAKRALPELELRWRRDLRLGEPVPIEIETIADPSAILHDLTVYVRPRGDQAWRAADVTLPAPGAVARLMLPPVGGRSSTALEVFAIASDQRGNEVHLWASRERPRELPLRYDPPTPWYRRWWVWAAVGGAVAVGTGVGVYAAVWEPSDRLDAPVGAR